MLWRCRDARSLRAATARVEMARPTSKVRGRFCPPAPPKSSIGAASLVPRRMVRRRNCTAHRRTWWTWLTIGAPVARFPLLVAGRFAHPARSVGWATKLENDRQFVGGAVMSHGTHHPRIMVCIARDPELSGSNAAGCEESPSELELLPRIQFDPSVPTSSRRSMLVPSSTRGATGLRGVWNSRVGKDSEPPDNVLHEHAESTGYGAAVLDPVGYTASFTMHYPIGAIRQWRSGAGGGGWRWRWWVPTSALRLGPQTNPHVRGAVEGGWWGSGCNRCNLIPSCGA